MSADRKDLQIERILVALDASPHSLAALEAAVDLAATFQAELAGLFVEDVDLLRVSDLSFVREVGLYSATARRVDGQRLEWQIRGHGRRVRRVFTITSERARVRWAFRVVRGQVVTEVLDAASQADMLVLGRSGWSLLRRGRLGSTVRGVLPARFGLTLILEEGHCLGNPMAVVFDGSAAGERAIVTADVFRRQSDQPQSLVVLLLTENPEQLRALREKSQAQLEDSTADDRYRPLTSTNAIQLADLLQREDCGTLVLPARSQVLQDEALLSLLEELDMPVLLVT